MDWLEITVDTEEENLDKLCEALEGEGVEGLIIEDETDFRSFLENNREYWDYVDEELTRRMENVCRVKFYLPADKKGQSELTRLRRRLPDFALAETHVGDQDWENNWRKYYRQIPVGGGLLIVPEWEEPEDAEGQKILRLDPGLIFGTGSHATTRMCLEYMQQLSLQGKDILDAGCGSGILSIAALILGANRAWGCDIDPKAPDVALRNAGLNRVENRLEVMFGDMLSDSALRADLGKRRYFAVFANIVADVLIGLCPYVKGIIAEGGCFVLSGIIEGRQADTEAALSANGFAVVYRQEREGWHMLAAQPEAF